MHSWFCTLVCDCHKPGYIFSETGTFDENPAKSMKCPTCSKTVSNRGSITQWMLLGDACKCALLLRERNAAHLEAAPEVSKACSKCGKRLPEKSGSLTHWIFSGDVCSCQRSMLGEKTKKPSLVVMTKDLQKFCTDTLSSIDTGSFGFRRDGKLNRIDHQDILATRSGDDNDTLMLPQYVKPEAKNDSNDRQRSSQLNRVLFWGLCFCLVSIGCMYSYFTEIQKANSIEKPESLAVPRRHAEVGDPSAPVAKGEWLSEFRKEKPAQSFIFNDASTSDDHVEVEPIVCAHVQLAGLGQEQISSFAGLEGVDIRVGSNEVPDKDLAKVASLHNICALDLINASGYSTSGIEALAKSPSLKRVRFRSKDIKYIPTPFLIAGWRRVPGTATEMNTGVYFMCRQ